MHKEELIEKIKIKLRKILGRESLDAVHEDVIKILLSGEFDLDLLEVIWENEKEV